MTVGEFSERAGIPASTLYKILSGERDPKMETFRRIVCTIREIEGVKKHGFIAVIASRGILKSILIYPSPHQSKLKTNSLS